jgi:chitinase
MSMMKKSHLILALILIVAFAGGFISGVLFSTNNTQQETSELQKPRKTEQAPTSQKKPKLKAKPKPAQPKVLIGYVQDFRDPNTVHYSQLTHVIFSFAHPTKDGRLLLNGATAINHLRTMVQKAHQHRIKAMLAVGGWHHIQGGESYEYFKTAISQPASRTRLVNELVGMADREKLDGIDIDFEHPRSEADAQNLAAFTKALSEKLHAKDKELSIAVYSKIHSATGTEVTSVVFKPSMFKDVDHVNIMAYDGQWDGEYNAANLSPYRFTEHIVNYWTNLFEKHDLSKEKLVLGVPFYAQPEDLSAGQLSYAAIVNNNPANAGRDVISMNGTTYHYNGVATIQKKTKLALDHGFGGMMLWEAGHDAAGPRSLTSAISEILKKSETEQAKQYTVKSEK